MKNIGQLIMTGISGLILTEDEKKFIGENNIGGVILFAHNYDSPGQLAELVNSIQTLRDEYPLFISVDHEGGRVIRFKKHFTQFPPMFDMQKLNSPKMCFQVHTIMAEELAACGINLNFSPCCDILTNPNNKVIGDRAFGADEDTVSKYISSAIRGLQTSNILSCAKHFPGHGSTTKDSHYGLPYVKTTIEDLRNLEFKPFIKAIKSRVEFIMMGHLVVDAIDPNLPTTLSENAYKIIRDEFRYKNLIITDDMEMQAITDHHTMEDAAVMAINAGADIILYRSMISAKRAFEALSAAQKNMKIKNQDIHDKVERIMECKKEHFKEYNPIYIPKILNKIGSKSSQIFLKDITDKIAIAANTEEKK